MHISTSNKDKNADVFCISIAYQIPRTSKIMNFSRNTDEQNKTSSDCILKHSPGRRGSS